MKIKLIIPIFIMIFLCSCSSVVKNAADEIRLNKWSAELENKSVVTLQFKGDTAKLNIKAESKEASAQIKGVSFIDTKRIVIVNNSDKELYTFNYTLKNNKLKLKYKGGAVSLTRKN